MHLYSTPKKSSAADGVNQTSPDLFSTSSSEHDTNIVPEKILREAYENAYKTPVRNYSAFSHRPDVHCEANETTALSVKEHSYKVAFSVKGPAKSEDSRKFEHGSCRDILSNDSHTSHVSLISTLQLFPLSQEDSAGSERGYSCPDQPAKALYAVNDGKMCENIQISAEYSPSEKTLSEHLRHLRETVEIINCSSPSDSASKSSVRLQSSIKYCAEKQNEISPALNSLISPIKTPPSIANRPSTASLERFSAEQLEDEQLPRTRKRNIGKLATALRKRIQARLSEMAMWRCDDSPKKVQNYVLKQIPVYYSLHKAQNHCFDCYPTAVVNIKKCSAK